MRALADADDESLFLDSIAISCYYYSSSLQLMLLYKTFEKPPQVNVVHKQKRDGAKRYFLGTTNQREEC